MGQITATRARKFEHRGQEFIALAIRDADTWAILVLCNDGNARPGETGHRDYLSGRVAVEDVDAALGKMQRRIEANEEPDELPGGGA